MRTCAPRTPHIDTYTRTQCVCVCVCVYVCVCFLAHDSVCMWATKGYSSCRVHPRFFFPVCNSRYNTTKSEAERSAFVFHLPSIHIRRVSPLFFHLLFFHARLLAWTRRPHVSLVLSVNLDAALALLPHTHRHHHICAAGQVRHVPRLGEV